MKSLHSNQLRRHTNQTQNCDSPISRVPNSTCLWLEFSLLLSNAGTPMTALQWLSFHFLCIHRRLEFDRHSINLRWPYLRLKTQDSIRFRILYLCRRKTTSKFNKNKKKLSINLSNRKLSNFARTQLLIGAQHLLNTIGGSYRHRALFNHNFIVARHFRNHSRRTFHILQVSCAATPIAEHFCRCIYRNENQFGLIDRRFNIIRKEEIYISTFLHYIVQPRLDKNVGEKRKEKRK